MKPYQTKEKFPNWKGKERHPKKKKEEHCPTKSHHPQAQNHKMGVAKEQPKHPKLVAWKTNMTQGKTFGCSGCILGKTWKANKVPWMYLRHRKAWYYSHKVWEGAKGEGAEHNYH